MHQIKSVLNKEMAHAIIPIVATTFDVIYWINGMFNVIYPDMQEEI